MLPKTLTVDGLIKKLKNVKKEVGGNTRAMVCNPYADGVGFEMLPISDAHFADGDNMLGEQCRKTIRFWEEQSKNRDGIEVFPI